MWLLARPIDSILPEAIQRGTSHQNGFSASIQTSGSANRASSTNFIGDGYSLLADAIARGFVEANGGRISVESLPGQGASFVVELPLPSDGSMAA